MAEGHDVVVDDELNDYYLRCWYGDSAVMMDEDGDDVAAEKKEAAPW
jgi:hypothetical protein